MYLQPKKKFKASKLIYVFIVLGIVALLFFYFKDFITGLIKLDSKDPNAMKDFVDSQGTWNKYISVSAVEALEMIVIALPAELVQTPAGITFPWYIALLLCDLGVCIGASIIYFLVNKLKIKPDFVAKKESKIRELERKTNGAKTQRLMYFLFICPIIPFGAICYYCSSKQISYRRYLLTCATGVIPSILSSIFIGFGIRYSIDSTLPIWALILIIIGVMALLIVVALIVSKKLFKQSKSKYSPFYDFILGLYGIYVKLHSKPNYIHDELYEEMLDIDGPSFYISNHLGMYDVYHGLKFLEPKKTTLVVNAYYTRNKYTRKVIKIANFIPKKMFANEIAPIRQMMKLAKNGMSIYMTPEARLSEDGVTNTIANGTEVLVKKLKLPLVIFNIRGSYLAKSKFHTTKHKIPVTCYVKKIIYPEEYENMSDKELLDIIQESINLSEYEYSSELNIKDKNAAKGYEYLIYKCPKCGKEYTIRADKNKLICDDCGLELELDEHSYLKENELGLHDLHEAYEYIKDIERKESLSEDKEIIYEEPVNIIKISFKGKKYDVKGQGKVILSKEGFKYIGTIGNEEKELFNSVENLQVLPFGVNDQYECYVDGDLYYFYPSINSRSCTKVSLLWDLIQEKYNSK